MMSNNAKSFDILAISLSILHNYFDSSYSTE